MGIFLSTTLPLFIYIGIDAFFEFKLAIILTVIYGIMEFIYYYIKDKRVDKLILISTVLIVFMGAISYSFENDSLFKLKPAILQLLAVFFLLYFIITDKSMLDIMKERMPKNARKIDPTQEVFIKKVTKDMAVVLFLHCGLIAYSAYYMSNAAWVFISGILPYILIIGLVMIEGVFFRKKMMNNGIQEMNNVDFSQINNSIRDRRKDDNKDKLE